MPRGDRTGPLGLGPLTGGGFGYCGGYSAPGFVTRGSWAGWRGYGFGGFGRGGYGYRHRFYATGIPGWQWWGPGGPWGTAGSPYPPVPTEQQVAAMQAEADRLERAAIEMRERAKELERRQGEGQSGTRGE
jgi:hypothetical protein